MDIKRGWSARQVTPMNVEERLIELFAGLAPEHEKTIEGLWATYRPDVQVVADCHPDGPLIMDAGLYRYIRFNHRMMRALWLSTFAAWEGYLAVHQGAQHEPVTLHLEKMREIVQCVTQVCTSATPDDIPFPAHVPPVGELVENDVEKRAVGEIAVFAAGWAFLHEVRHLIHQQEGTSASGSTADQYRKEELSCDEYATRFLLENLTEYALRQNTATGNVNFKRQLGVLFALFSLTLVAEGRWHESDTHPAIQTRIEAVLKVLEQLGQSRPAAVVAIAAFYALKAIYPDAPSPISAISERAVREGWTADDLRELM